jgi:hypothetical protein
MKEIETKQPFVLGQRYAFATVSLVLGISCFTNLLGLEKAILAIIFGWLALKSEPGPMLTIHRTWARVGISLGILPLIILPTLIVLNLDKIREIIELLSKLNGGR